MTINAPAHPDSANKPEPMQYQCKLCWNWFKRKRSWQKYCCPEHKKAHEKIKSKMISECRPALNNAAEKLARARVSKDD